LDVRDFETWYQDSVERSIERHEEKVAWPATNIQLAGESLERLNRYFETERYMRNNPDERERLKRES